jgi:uncharacterized repeat protein (TIGR03809 family)
MLEQQAFGRFARTAQKWRDLVEKRSLHFVELHASGRWRRYYTEDQFFALLREAAELAEIWTHLAPRPEDNNPIALPPVRRPAASSCPAA